LELKPRDRDQALLHSRSTFPGSKWLDKLPVVLFLRLDGQSIQGNARIGLGVHNFATMSQAWHCTCGQVVDSNNVAHALGCLSLNSLIITRHDENADALRERVGR
jgi:hypothetical protein